MTHIPDQRYAEAIAHARRVLPSRIRQRLTHVQFLCGVDPVFAGLHHYSKSKDGRSYGATAHIAYPRHIARPRAERVTTVVLPQPIAPWLIVHELGHALDEAIGFDHGPVQPVTEYAKTDSHEAFAEAFVSWLYHYGDRDVLHRDAQTVALFERLAA